MDTHRTHRRYLAPAAALVLAATVIGAVSYTQGARGRDTGDPETRRFAAQVRAEALAESACQAWVRERLTAPTSVVLGHLQVTQTSTGTPAQWTVTGTAQAPPAGPVVWWECAAASEPDASGEYPRMIPLGVEIHR